MQINNKPVIAALDLGSSKVTLLLAEVNSHGFNILAKSTVHHTGVKQGSIINISKTSEAILKAKKEVESQSSHEAKSVYVSVGGLNIKSFTSNGLAAVEDNEVTSREIHNVLKTAKAVPFKDDRQIIHALPKEYNLDGQGEIQNPIGMQGIRLEAQVHLITAFKTVFPNMMTAIENAGLLVKEFVLQAYASSFSVLSEQEKELGVCLVEMGGGTCEWITFKNGAVTDTGAVALGGINFTNDISYGLRTPSHEAEKIKLQFGTCSPDPENIDESFEVSDVSGSTTRAVMVNQLSEIISPRAMETLRLLISDVKKNGHGSKELTAGFVLTGGASQLKGLDNFAQKQFDEPIRVAYPKEVPQVGESLMDSSFSCALGLLKYASTQMAVPSLAQERAIRFKNKASHSLTETKALQVTNKESEEKEMTFAQQFKEFIGL